MSKLAIHGGSPIRTTNFPGYNTIGIEEKKAVERVLDSGILSKYLGSWSKDFMGGEEVLALEREWALKFKVKHAFAVNSNTSGLIAAMGAIGISPGDEVIVGPTSMAISAIAPLFYGGIPVFTDIEENYYCLDPKHIEAKITKKTKAIIAVDIFGHPYERDTINAIAKKHGLFVIEDAAQAPGGMYKGDYSGTLGDIGVFSLNYHKHIHSGEGGMVVTNNDELANKIALIRNHAESVVGAKGDQDLVNMMGFNFRMTEIEAAITREQLKKLDGLLDSRLKSVNSLRSKLLQIPAITGGGQAEGAKHVYYGLPFNFNSELAGVHRNKFIAAVRAELPVDCKYREGEGPLIGYGYVKPIHLQPIFQKKIAMGNQGFPFNLGNPNYSKGICPVAERMNEETIIHTAMFGSHFSESDIVDVSNAFYKVWENRNSL
jgi:dTDP-4-amino-4,6-dideoxygalactose transaminase